MHRMLARHPRHIRTKALALLAVFLSAGTSLPSPDALAYHGTAGAERTQVHIEPAAGCLHHAGHCTLGRTAPGSQAGLTFLGEVRAESAGKPVANPVSAPSFFSADPRGNPLSRAPPVLLA